MPFFQLTLLTAARDAAAVSEVCEAQGALSTTLQDHGDEPLFCETLGAQPLWQDTEVVALFDMSETIEPIVKVFKDDARVRDCVLSVLDDQDWVRASRDAFLPIAFSQNFWVCPSWQAAPDPTARCLRLDPGLAFGTGNHETTWLCLEYLATCDFLNNSTVIDYGCGSGILGLAALILGADEVFAVDIDPQALLASKNNRDLNPEIATRFHVCFAHELLPREADLVLANILVDPLTTLASTLAALNKPGSTLILSGLLVDQVPRIRFFYDQFYYFQQVIEKSGWVLCCLQKK